MRLQNSPFNIDATLCCGQVFRWDKKGDWWYGVVLDKVFKVRLINDELEFVNSDWEFVKHYFGLDDPLERISERITKDEHIAKCLRLFFGLRIIRQDPWECLISYLCATYKSIPAIRRMLFHLSKKYGKKVVFDGFEFYTFPTPRRLAYATEKGLRGCGLGYRAKYVLETSKKVYDGDFKLEELANLLYKQAKKELTSLLGVGLKVADCILLFSLGKLEAFPVDIRIKRSILKNYSGHFTEALVKKMLVNQSISHSDYERLSAFGRDYFGKYAGYAQEYLYHYQGICH